MGLRLRNGLRLIRPLELEVALPKAIDKISAPLSPAEQQRLHQYVQANPTPRKIGLLLGLELGLRIGEICGLQWGDFDLKLGTLNTIKKLYDGLDMTLGQFFSCPLFDELDQEIQ